MTDSYLHINFYYHLTYKLSKSHDINLYCVRGLCFLSNNLIKCACNSGPMIDIQRLIFGPGQSSIPNLIANCTLI